MNVLLAILAVVVALPVLVLVGIALGPPILVMVFDGETTLTFLAEDGERSSRLCAGDLVVVPKGTWHRFETPDSVTVYWFFDFSTVNMSGAH